MKSYLISVIFLLNECTCLFSDNITSKPDIFSTNSTTNVNCEKSTTIVGEHKLTWNETPIGSPAYPNEFCSDEKGIIPHRDCSGDYNSPRGKWLDVIGNCSGDFLTSNLTNTLHRVLVKYAIDGVWNFALLAQISSRIKEFTCIDLYLMSKALYYMTVEEYLPNLFHHFAETMDNTLEVFSELRESCSTFNASSYILGSINVFFNRVTEEKNDVRSIVMPNFVFQISNPFFEGITGLALYENGDESFRNYTIKTIFVNESYDDISTENLRLAGYVPNDLINTLSTSLNDEEKSAFKVIIVAFRNNKLFDLGENTRAISKVIGLSISGFCSPKNVALFDIYSKPLVESVENKSGEWFTVDNHALYSDNVISMCSYPPVTYMFLYDKEEKDQSCKKSDKFYYAELIALESKSSSLNFHNQNPVFDILSSLSISINYAQPPTVIEALYKRHHHALKALMLFGCTLSLFGLFATAMTLIFIKKWHEKRMYTIQLDIAMGFETFLFLIDSDISYITYIILYYFILSQFSWMMLIGYMQYLKFVKVFNDNSSNVIKSLLIGWLIPALVIVIPIGLYPDCLYCEYCSEKRNILVYFVIIPTSLIILINITIYLAVMVNISRSKGKQYGSNLSKKTIRVGILLPFMLGITWIFVFALVSPWQWFSLAGSYLFHLIAPVQAFVLFIFVVVLDDNTRKAWKMHWLFLKKKLNKKAVKPAPNNIFTIS